MERQKRKRTRKLIILTAMLYLLVFVCGCSGTDAKNYRVTFHLNYANFVGGPTGQTVQAGELVKEPTPPTRKGYTFGGWYKQATCSEPWLFATDKVNEKTVLYAKWDNVSRDRPPDVTDMSGMNASTQEYASDYRLFYLPDNGGRVGDPMPYCDGDTVKIYYLQDEGGSLRHSVYRADSTNLTQYNAQGEMLRSGNVGVDDYWIGTGSVVRAGNDYYLFYTAHNQSLYPKEKFAVAKSTGNDRNFVKQNFRIEPPDSLSKNDFRDPQAFYDAANQKFDIIGTSNSGGTAHIVKFSVSLDLTKVVYDGILFSQSGYWNLECPDIFEINGTYYLTYSAQNDTLWYASSKSKFSGYGVPKRLEGKLFYAAKSFVKNGEVYLAGWIARRELPDNNAYMAWAGNLAVHRVTESKEGVLALMPIDELEQYYASPNSLKQTEVALNGTTKTEIASSYESYSLEGTLRFENTNEFGFAFGNGTDDLHLRFLPNTHKITFAANGGITLVAEIETKLLPNTDYNFRFVAEGSVGILYFGDSALSVRMYGQNNQKISFFTGENTVKCTNLKQYLRSVKAE